MEWQFDKRIVERNITKGFLTQKDLEKRLKSLPDLADQVAPVEVTEDGDDGDDDGKDDE
jgi:hypothetical protein